MGGVAVKAYYWGPPAKSNFGDLLTVHLLEQFADVAVEWATPEEAEVVVCGSTLDVLPAGWDGIVAGSGLLKGTSYVDLRWAQVLGVRGRLTRDRLDLPYAYPTPVLGDPGLLASELVNPHKAHKLGIVPHWTDQVLHPRFKHLDHVLIPTDGDPLEVIRQIGSCEKIVTSSLHGMIVADSFGIPRRVEKFPAMEHPWEGGEFKFHDHASALGMVMEWGKRGGEVAPRERVERVQIHLFEMLCELGVQLASS